MNKRGLGSFHFYKLSWFPKISVYPVRIFFTFFEQASKYHGNSLYSVAVPFWTETQQSHYIFAKLKTIEYF